MNNKGPCTPLAEARTLFFYARADGMLDVQQAIFRNATGKISFIDDFCLTTASAASYISGSHLLCEVHYMRGEGMAEENGRMPFPGVLTDFDTFDQSFVPFKIDLPLYGCGRSNMKLPVVLHRRRVTHAAR